MELVETGIYPIWTIWQENRVAENGLDYDQNIIEINDHELIKQLPLRLKIIIAYYLKYIPKTVWEESDEEDIKIAKSMGNYETLEEMTKEMLKGHSQITENNELIIEPEENYPRRLEIKKVGQLLYVEHIGMLDQKKKIDEYKVWPEGKIEFIRRI
jgi:hypothetical protein